VRLGFDKIGRRSAASLPLVGIALCIAALVTTESYAAEIIPPKPAAYFNDYAGVVSKDAVHRFNEQLAQFERDTSNQVVVAIFPKMQSDDDAAAYGQRIAHAWGVGQKDKRNGVVLLVFIADRKTSIQVGYGLEGALPDITAFDIRENHINPHFRKGDYEGGLADGIDSIFKAIRGEYQGTGKTANDGSYMKEKSNMLVPNLMLFFFFGMFLFFISRVIRQRGYHYSGSGGGYVGGWSGGGGGWSSGDSGGGSSGFSGGGGDFGGGGSSGSW
jgi:uncharacterized protein